MERNVNKGLTLLLLHLSAVALAKTPTGAVEGLFSISSTASSSNRATQKDCTYFDALTLRKEK